MYCSNQHSKDRNSIDLLHHPMRQKDNKIYSSIQLERKQIKYWNTPTQNVRDRVRQNINEKHLYTKLLEK
jgi:hypothetical protein